MVSMHFSIAASLAGHALGHHGSSAALPVHSAFTLAVVVPCELLIMKLYLPSAGFGSLCFLQYSAVYTQQYQRGLAASRLVERTPRHI